MAIRSHPRRGWIPVFGAALALAVVLPGAAFADTTPTPTIYPAASDHATIQLSTGSFAARVVVNTRIVFTCDPLLVYDWETGLESLTTSGTVEFGAVTIIQAAGRTINSGEGSFYGGAVVCDGSTQNQRDVAVVAGIAPWKAGSAVAGARITISAQGVQVPDYASTGALTVKLGH